MSLTHPWGLLALLALPAIVALHLLRHRRRSFVAPALFLLPAQAPSPLAGPRIEAFRNSLPLWLQLLAALIFTWLIVQPRWDQQSQRQRLVVVLDSSASMQAVAPTLRENLAQEISQALGPRAHQTDLILLSSDLDQGQLHRSDPNQSASAQTEALKQTLSRWDPWSDAVDLPAVIELGRALAGEQGRLLFVSDHRPKNPLPEDVALALVGEPRAQVGCVGARFLPAQDGGTAQFEILLRNYSDEPQTRRWRAQSGSPPEFSQPNASGSEGQAALPADGFISVRIAAAHAADFLEAAPQFFALEPDDFPADDTLPLLPPHPKILRVWQSADPAPAPWLARLWQILPAIEIVPERAQADLIVQPAASANAPDSPHSAASAPALSQAQLLWTPVTASAELEDSVEGIPEGLAEGLDFGGLNPAVPEAPEAIAPAARTLAWVGQRPLISVRDSVEPALLQFHFDPAQQDAGNIPALPVLVARFVEALRAPLARSSQEMRGSGERLANPLPAPLSTEFQPIHGTTERSAQPLAAAELFNGLALPRRPGLFISSSGENGTSPLRSRVALSFANFSEADLRANQNTTFPELRPRAEARPERQSPWLVWVLAALGLLLGILWWFDRPQPGRRS